MSDPSPETPTLQFECPLCAGAFEIGSEWLGHEVECPHCGGVVELAVEGGAEAPAPAEAPAEAPEAPAEPAAEPDGAEAPPAKSPPAESPPAESRPPEPQQATPAPRPLTGEERAAARRRVNTVLAVVGAVVLVGTFLLLSWLAG